MSEPPVEAACDHCKQTRPLFLYQPDHGMHLNPAVMLGCRWCNRATQPLLCTRCWGKERELEENDTGLAEDAETLEQICATNRRVMERREAKAAADRAACEGIAAATEAAEGAGQ